MGFTFDQLQRKDARTLAYEFEDGDKFKYVVSSNRITFPILTELQSALGGLNSDDKEQSGAAQAQAMGTLSKVIIEWDMVNEDGTPTEITAENMVALPLPMLLEMMEKIMDLVAPNPESAAS